MLYPDSEFRMLVVAHGRARRSQRLEREDVGREGLHHIARIRLDKARQRGHGAWHGGLGDKTEKAEHGKAAVVDLDDPPLGLELLGAGVGAEGAEHVKGDGVRQHLEGGEVAYLAALCVVLLAI